MLILRKLHWIFTSYMAPTEGEGGSGGGAVDRGDDFTPTDGDDPNEGGDASKGDPSDDDDEEAKKLAEEAEVAKKAAEEAKSKDKGKEGEDTSAKDGDDKDKKRKDDRIPASRHKEILEREREKSRAEREALERELAKFKDGQKIADTNEEIAKAEEKLQTMEQEYAKLITDGEHKTAAAKMTEIRKLERSISEKTVEIRATAAQAQAVEQVRYDMTVDRIEEAYPALNPQHEDFDKDKIAEVLELKKGFQLQGYTPAQALQKAVKYVMPKPETRQQERAVETEARPDKKDVEAERKKQAAEKAAEANGKQPPNASKVGMDHDKAGGKIDAKSVLKMSQDDFAKLDDATLARMRGDVIA